MTPCGYSLINLFYYREVTQFTIEDNADSLYSYQATDKYLGDQLALYHHTLYFTISYQPSVDSQSIDRSVVVRGDDLSYELW